ncbi:signal peptidase I [Evansella caseinilytica]|uniref:Signal peptidase I n=1 Tax=Evansella caseinilytica TaxID=1503961 RepID=A0A1H3R158_9BACI|nr:signal peptidase I [Evansella caseinilytica]SDZ19326.1 signal peptidase I [Evansella caseinilytica]
MEIGEQVFQEKKRWKRELWNWIKAIGIVILSVALIRAFLFTNYIVYGQSMMPTIQDGERIIVNKIGYELHQPERFDLIIFHATESTDYIKRIIGLPGDHISYENDVLFVNGEPLEENFLDFYRETYSAGLFTEDFRLEAVTGESTVPEDCVFVLGDNRQNSLDSRHIGFVGMDAIVGKANIAYWPLSKFRIF